MGARRLTEDQKAEMILRRHLGENRHSIAADFGVCAEYPTKLANGWTDERVALLREMAINGLSGGQMAAELGITRSAVIGKMHRMGFKFLRPAYAHSQKGVPKQRYLRPSNMPSRMKAPDFRADPFTPRSVDVVPKNISIYELTADTCKWPCGDDAKTMTFCGHKPFGTLPYCADHARLVYVAPSKRKLSAFRFTRPGQKVRAA